MPRGRTDWRRSLIHPTPYRVLAVYSIALGGSNFFFQASGSIKLVLFLAAAFCSGSELEFSG